jgi:hypothetical protein
VNNKKKEISILPRTLIFMTDRRSDSPAMAVLTVCFLMPQESCLTFHLRAVPVLLCKISMKYHLIITICNSRQTRELRLLYKHISSFSALHIFHLQDNDDTNERNEWNQNKTDAMSYSHGVVLFFVPKNQNPICERVLQYASWICIRM